jgi:nucleotide-binding universal stress UspA family protein
MVLSYGEELGSRLGSEIILYHVHGHEHINQERMHQTYLDRLAEAINQDIKNSTANYTEVKVTTKVESGEPAENICNLVAESKADLIIMAAVSTSGLKIGKMLGSVTDHVCRTVPIPVMLIRPQSVKQTDKKRLINHMLIPLDGSELSKLALPVGEELATKLKVSTTIFQMATMIRLYDNDGSGSSTFVDTTKFDEENRKRVSAEMVVLEKELKEQGLDVTSIVTSGFDAAYEIIDLCKKIDINLVVMSTHGRSGLGRWIVGSVAEKVLRHGETPLLLVHARAG